MRPASDSRQPLRVHRTKARDPALQPQPPVVLIGGLFLRPLIFVSRLCPWWSFPGLRPRAPLSFSRVSRDRTARSVPAEALCCATRRTRQNRHEECPASVRKGDRLERWQSLRAQDLGPRGPSSWLTQPCPCHCLSISGTAQACPMPCSPVLQGRPALSACQEPERREFFWTVY